MCGIIGVIGKDDVTQSIFDGLKRLEYRGYDSAGIATIHDGQLDRRRAEGKLDALRETLASSPLGGSIGIGHTRWATHGPAIVANAHPHRGERVAVVHNGIIENYKGLKKKLIADGISFSSDTDTEVIAHLFSQNLNGHDDIRQAAARTFAALEGAYAIALIVDGNEDEIVVARKGSPLAIGHGDGEMYLGSDAFALAPFTNRVCYLKDGDWAVMRGDGAEIFALGQDGAVERQVETVDAAAAMVDKGNYRHFMMKEIHEQSEVLSRTFGQYIDPEARRVLLPENNLDFSKINRIILVACGTAYFAAQVGRNWIERYARIPASIDIASEFRYRNAPMDKDCLAVFVSQSGETADTLAALHHCKAHGLQTIGIVNVPESSITRDVDLTFPTYAGPEIGVASTKAFTAQLGALASLALGLGRVKGTIDAAEEARLSGLLLTTPRLANDVLARKGQIEEIAKGFTDYSSALFIGRNTMWPLALEGALKLKEISYIHAEGFAAGELKHGSIALVDETVPIITIAPDDELFEKTVSNMQEVLARGGKVIMLGSEEGIEKAGEGCMATIKLPVLDPFISPILYALPLQLLAYYAAVAKGTDVDQPRNLAKSVTVE
ncbi:glutamine--fructose-6-phosphate transaminase (isomerizing) [Alphaproteobacteria bacterium]|nr:glutamine--fructose-6-phosphate transaminase (isomerizing) [Alphaproteobacteria bacterium]MDA8625713.1 glutamine--fructose-6-phosphate transaminase (isomerizing) [Alphaproteobacteria bacterium]MDA8666958.1 glutamine--fructose-6-phosphate transaminase (isomerizing) [Alphaproteobacteria bacterium]MDA8725399.1 glutamine--fructose-6-phosphate transaminase (isomerizing) [Alphaproteobacteria bacterium]MDA8779779.1 glutamine--fructose-6-phosphate transaminase (isomerizing) [Alphaproteobacteria bact